MNSHLKIAVLTSGPWLFAQPLPEVSLAPSQKAAETPVGLPSQGREPTAEIKAFLEAREQSMRAGLAEPHRAMLQAMADSKDPTKHLWALARLVEAGDMNSYPAYAEAMVRHVRGMVQSGSGFGDQKARPAAEVIGARAPEATHISPKSSFWLSLAKTLEELTDAPVDSAMYSVWCFNTSPSHRRLIELVAQRIKSRVTLQSKAMDPWSDPRFWIVTDWAMAWGDEEDFNRLEQLIHDTTAKREFQRRFNELRKIQAFLPCLSANRADREQEGVPPAFSMVPKDMVEKLRAFQGAPSFSFSHVKIKLQPEAPIYPKEAKARRLMADMAVEITIDPSGMPCMVRAKPGPFLAFFAPTCLQYSEAWRFKPAEINGIPTYARFLLTMPFRLR